MIDNLVMTKRSVETNVRVPQCALDALVDIKAERGFRSRDETVQQILSEYVTAQKKLQKRDDLSEVQTHVATVMRYPLPGRGARSEPSVPLRLRLTPDVAEAAKRFGFVLPGQSQFRGHHQYQARPLTDAVLTAISLQKDFSDDVLAGIRPRIRQEAARGLWQLVVVSSLSEWEAAIFDRYRKEQQTRDKQRRLGRSPDEFSEVSLVADELFERNISWHSPERNKLARELARELLSGPDAATVEQQLFDHDLLNPDWRKNLTARRALYTSRLPTPTGPSTLLHRFDGRGAGAVWRARRNLISEEIVPWLLKSTTIDSSHEVTCTVRPPDWILKIPPGWRPHELSKGPTDVRWDEHVAQARVFDLRAEGQRFLWPTVATPTGPEPVPGIETFLSAARSHPKSSSHSAGFLIEILLREFLPPDTNSLVRVNISLKEDGLVDLPGYLQEELHQTVQVPAYRAHEFGFIDKATRDQLVTDAKVANDENVDKLLAELHSHRESHVRDFGVKLSSMKRQPAKLSYALNTAKKYLDEHNVHVRFSYRQAAHSWPVVSVADAIATGAPRDTLSWLTGYSIRATSHLLHRSMELTSRQAFGTSFPLTES